jgi:ubiquinone/menaquinone biosynthesis C-methylase UbiE
MTVEIAKLARRAVGIDVNPYVERIRVPPRLAARLEFQRVSGTATPFPAGQFDRVLASEVLPMIPEPEQFLSEVRRVLKPGGRLVVANGTGLFAIADAYRENAPRLAALRRRHPGRFPPSYDAFIKEFLRIAGTAGHRFMREAEIIAMIEANGFAVTSVRHSPREIAGTWIAWRQFELYLAEDKVVPNSAFLWRFLYLSLLSLFDRRDYRGGLIVAATARV